jgi:2-oxoglutarate ferredoxin oxidoreductase subunit beta
MTSGAAPTPKTAQVPLGRKDFVTDQEVRWCPGCGDYSILAQTQKLMPDLGIEREKIVFISGIGCSSRLPYYMNTYGFHSIHGRAPTIATGLKAARPDLQVWVVTGDGDGLSIGGNHLLHIMRRNVDVVIVLFNNRIYGLTKGQYSPTSEFGKRTKSSPMGTIDYPLNPLSVALGAEASFVARSLDIDVHHLIATLEKAARHKGTSFVEVYQNCNVFNDGAFMEFADKGVRPDRTVQLENGKPLIFGKDQDKGIRLNGMTPEIVHLGNGVSEGDLLVHDEKNPDPALAFILTRMQYPEFPVPMGVFRAVERPTYDDLMTAQIAQAVSQQGKGDLTALLAEGDTWTVE